ncbi:MAG: hypothetical protein COB30_014350 [Ectothiorhodospiraceae bacterium]|nr:hypothetical protein [Ectothiorhodospiraceae bacterium]
MHNLAATGDVPPEVAVPQWNREIPGTDQEKQGQVRVKQPGIFTRSALL